MSKKIPYELYDLIPSQETMHLMVKYSFKKQIVQIPCSFTAETNMNFDLMQKAFEIEIERNDSLRNRFTVVDKQLKQYFVEPFKMTVPRKFFRSKMRIKIGKPIPYNENIEEMIKIWSNKITAMLEGKDDECKQS